MTQNNVNIYLDTMYHFGVVCSCKIPYIDTDKLLLIYSFLYSKLLFFFFFQEKSYCILFVKKLV